MFAKVQNSQISVVIIWQGGCHMEEGLDLIILSVLRDNNLPTISGELQLRWPGIYKNFIKVSLWSLQTMNLGFNRIHRGLPRPVPGLVSDVHSDSCSSLVQTAYSTLLHHKKSKNCLRHRVKVFRCDKPRDLQRNIEVIIVKQIYWYKCNHMNCNQY